MRRLAGTAVISLSLMASGAAAQVTNTYSYDAQGRLITSARAVSGTAYTTNYTIDDADNRTQRSTTVAAGRSSANEVPQQSSQNGQSNTLPAVARPAPGNPVDTGDGDAPLNPDPSTQAQ